MRNIWEVTSPKDPSEPIKRGPIKRGLVTIPQKLR
jgi:hypothetical protein